MAAVSVDCPSSTKLGDLFLFELVGFHTKMSGVGVAVKATWVGRGDSASLNSAANQCEGGTVVG